MTEVKTRKVLPYPSGLLFGIVSDVAAYPEFLPWCLGARVYSEKETESQRRFRADLRIGYKSLRENFTSDVLADAQALLVESRFVKGPFSKLYSRWRFAPEHESPLSTDVDFYVEFRFRSRLMHAMLESLFTEAQFRMVRAFEARANTLYEKEKLP